MRQAAPENKPCKFCQKSFEPNRDWQDFCPGDKCRNAYHSIRRNFVAAFNVLAAEVSETAKSKGWKKSNDAEGLMLMVAELGEACTALRHGNPADNKIANFSGVEAELADVIIYIMNYAMLREYKIAEAVVAKIEFNKTRPERHGGKLF